MSVSELAVFTMTISFPRPSFILIIYTVFSLETVNALLKKRNREKEFLKEMYYLHFCLFASFLVVRERIWKFFLQTEKEETE